MTLKNRIMLIVGLIAMVVGGVIVTDQVANAATSNGWTTTATVSATTVQRGATMTLTVNVTSSTATTALVDLEVHNASGKRFQRAWDQQSFAANTRRVFTTTWTVPTNEPTGTHTVKVGIFRPGWASLTHWNDAAAKVTIATATTPSTTTTTTTTTLPPTTTSTTTTTTTTTTTLPPPTTTSTTAPPAPHFSTLPAGAALPSDASCQSRVRPMPERRPINNGPNHTKGSAVSGLARVTGDFTGTTDEIIEWVACKWGIDEDIVRAQIAKESWWHQDAKGDLTTDQNACHPMFRTGSGSCPESIGLGQVRFQYHTIAFTNNYAITSSAFNLDYTYSVWRACFEGQFTWLNTVERGATYAAGDAWGCVGLWFAGRWHTSPAETYIAAVKDYLNQRVWESANFQGG